MGSKVKKKRVIQLWVEGYVVTGNSGTAQYLGAYEAMNLDSAIKKWYEEQTNNIKQYVDLPNKTYWGCRFFDNEEDARKSFG